METEKSYVGMMNCYFCNKPKGILLDRRLRNTFEKEQVIDMEPCDECKKYMEQGVILIGVRDGESGDNPYRTGEWLVVTEDFIKRAVKGKLKEELLKKRMCFIEQSTLKQMGLVVKNEI